MLCPARSSLVACGLKRQNFICIRHDLISVLSDFPRSYCSSAFTLLRSTAQKFSTTIEKRGSSTLERTIEVCQNRAERLHRVSVPKYPTQSNIYKFEALVKKLVRVQLFYIQHMVNPLNLDYAHHVISVPQFGVDFESKHFHVLWIKILRWVTTRKGTWANPARWAWPVLVIPQEDKTKKISHRKTLDEVFRTSCIICYEVNPKVTPLGQVLSDFIWFHMSFYQNPYWVLGDPEWEM